MTEQSSSYRVVPTADGFNTLYDPHTGDHFHSLNGAGEESRHVYVEAGWRHLIEAQSFERVRLLEVGFGTGLNAFCTKLLADELSIATEYHALEPFPLDAELLSLVYQDTAQIEQNTVQSLIQASNELSRLSPNFSLAVHQNKLEDFESEQTFDLIYYDAFAPRFQAEMWSADAINHAISLLKPDGVLVTYSAQGQFRRLLEAASCFVESLPGPAGKREITRATKLA